MVENFLNLVKEKDTHVQEAQRISSKMDPKWPTSRHIIINMAKLKDKERILKAKKQRQLVSYKGASIRLSSDFSKQTLQAEGIGMKYSKYERQGPTTKATLPSKATISNWLECELLSGKQFGNLLQEPYKIHIL